MTSNTHKPSECRLSVAPMMDWTDRHCRMFHRQFSHHTLLYTEMVTAEAIRHGDADHLLRFSAEEGPVALQLGGSDPDLLAAAVQKALAYGYVEFNLNVGCPSDRVQSGRFGACLMAEPDLVADCMSAMKDAAQGIECTVKCRIGINADDPAKRLPAFLERVSAAGIARFAIHARKAWLEGLSPKENREVPPLDYPLVHQMKRDFPALHISINGGIVSLEEALVHLEGGLDGVMVGRAAYHDTATILSAADRRIFGHDCPDVPPETAVEKMLPYIEAECVKGTPLHRITRHMLGAFTGRPGARAWRRALSENAYHKGAGPQVVRDALRHIVPAAA